MAFCPLFSQNSQSGFPCPSWEVNNDISNLLTWTFSELSSSHSTLSRIRNSGTVDSCLRSGVPQTTGRPCPCLREKSSNSKIAASALMKIRSYWFYNSTPKLLESCWMRRPARSGLYEHHFVLLWHSNTPSSSLLQNTHIPCACACLSPLSKKKTLPVFSHGFDCKATMRYFMNQDYVPKPMEIAPWVSLMVPKLIDYYQPLAKRRMG